MRRDEIQGLTPLRTWEAINDREKERVERIEADWQQRLEKLNEQRAEAAQRRAALTQQDKLEALYDAD